MADGSSQNELFDGAEKVTALSGLLAGLSDAEWDQLLAAHKRHVD